MGRWYSAEERNQHVQQYLASGLTLQKYGDLNNLKKSTLAGWVQSYNKATLVLSTNFQDVTPILKQQSPLTNSMVKLNLPNGLSLEFDSSILHQVIEEFK